MHTNTHAQRERVSLTLRHHRTRGWVGGLLGKRRKECRMSEGEGQPGLHELKIPRWQCTRRSRRGPGESCWTLILRCFLTEGLQGCFDKEIWSNIRGHFIGSERNLQFNMPHLCALFFPIQQLPAIHMCFERLLENCPSWKNDLNSGYFQDFNSLKHRFNLGKLPALADLSECLQLWFWISAAMTAFSLFSEHLKVTSSLILRSRLKYFTSLNPPKVSIPELTVFSPTRPDFTLSQLTPSTEQSRGRHHKRHKMKNVCGWSFWVKAWLAANYSWLDFR